MCVCVCVCVSVTTEVEVYPLKASSVGLKLDLSLWVTEIEPNLAPQTTTVDESTSHRPINVSLYI